MAKFIDESSILQVLQAVDIVDVVSGYVALVPKGKEMLGLCPFHNDRRPSMNVSPSKQIFKCFSCGAGGDAIKFVMLKEHMTFPEALEVLAERAGVQLPQRRQETSGSGAGRNVLEAVNRWAAQHFRRLYDAEPTGDRARKYVADRGINEDTARRFGLGWAPDSWDIMKDAAQEGGQRADHLVELGLLIAKDGGGYYDRFRERLMFPVIDALGRIIGFGGRTLGDDPAKYLNSPESVLFQKGQTLYGIHRAKDAIIRSKTAVVVEGYTDCLMAHQFGVDNVVATLGTALTEGHAKALSRYAEKIVLVFDSDQAGEKAADRAIDIFFGQKIEVRLASLPKGKDPCDFLLEQGPEAFADLLAGATEALEYKWQLTRQRIGESETVEGRKKAVDEFLLVVANAASQGHMDAIALGFLENHVAKVVGRSAADVHRQLQQLWHRRGGRGTAGAAPSRRRRENVERDSYVAAQRQLLEVLLNKPDLFAMVRGFVTGPELFRNAIDQAIAKRVWDYCSRGGAGPLSEIMATCQDPELCDIMTDLAADGEKRGNYEKTLEGALANLQLEQVEQDRREIRDMVLTAEQDYGEDAEAALLMEFQAKYQPNLRRSGAR